MNHPTSKELVQELSRRSRGHGDGPVEPGVVFLIDQADAVEEAVPLVQGTLLHRRGSARRRSRTLTARIAQSTSICISVAVAPPTRSTSLIRADRADQRDAAEVQPPVRAGQATVRGGGCRLRPGGAFPRIGGGVLVVVLLALGLAVRIVKQYEQGVLFRLGRVLGLRQPGLRMIIPFVDVLHRVSLRIITMPIQSQGITTRDNVSVGVSAVAYFRVVDAVKSVVAIENVHAAIDQIAQTTLRKVVGQHTLDETLSETDRINLDIREILDVTTVEWGVEVTLVELKDIQLPDTMKRAMAKQAEAEREKRAKIINAEGESLAAAALGDASDTMMAHPLALQLRNLQSLVEIGVDKNTTVVFPAPIMTTISELGSFLAREAAAAAPAVPPSRDGTIPVGASKGVANTADGM